MKRTGCVKISDTTEQMFGYEMLIFWVVEKEGKVERMGVVGVGYRCGCLNSIG